MPKHPQHHLLLAVHEMPTEATAMVRALGAVHGWPVRCEDGTLPRVRSGEVLVATAPVWLALAGLTDAQRPRGLLLLTESHRQSAGMGMAAVVQAWPCAESVLLDHLSGLMVPGPLTLDPVSRTVNHRGHPVSLTPKECRILQVLLGSAGEAVAREVLEATLHVWGQEFESNTLDVHVHRLRRKLPDAGIRAVRGYGYVLIAQRRRASQA